MKLYIHTDKESGARFVYDTDYEIETIEAEFIESDTLTCEDCAFQKM